MTEYIDDDPLIAELRRRGVVTGGVHRTDPVSEQPVVRLARWQAFETPAGTKHFMGWDVGHHEGRVSSAVTAFDIATREAITSSGRKYALIGHPGSDADARYVLGAWLARMHLSWDDIIFIEIEQV